MIVPWMLLGRLLALGTTGYLYSRHTRTFVGRQGRLLSMHAAPLPFTIRTRGGGVRLAGRSGGRAFRVTHVGGAVSSQFRIEMNRAGEIRIRSGRRCETVSEGFLREEGCRSSARQRFVWVPAALFRSEALKEDGGAIDRHPGRRHRGVQEGQMEHLGAGLSPGLLVRYAGMFCDSHPAAQECLSYRRRAGSEDAEVRRDSGSSTEESTEDQAADGPAANPQTARVPDSPEEARKRVRGVYAKGADSTDSAECRMECVRNPQNNQCYYQLDGRGNLTPLVGPRHCPAPKRLCDLQNPLDRFFCEVAFENNYSSFSKLLD